MKNTGANLILVKVVLINGFKNRKKKIETTIKLIMRNLKRKKV